MRRIVNDAERISTTSTGSTSTQRNWNSRATRASITIRVGEKIAIPDTQYASDFWQDVDDEGLGGGGQR